MQQMMRRSSLCGSLGSRALANLRHSSTGLVGYGGLRRCGWMLPEPPRPDLRDHVWPEDQFDKTLLVAISDAIRHIAQTNDQLVSDRVQQERDRIVQAHADKAETSDFSAGLAWEIHQQHDRWAIDKLYDHVQFLLWLKLRRECKHACVIDDDERFLGSSDLRRHLKAERGSHSTSGTRRKSTTDMQLHVLPI